MNIEIYWIDKRPHRAWILLHISHNDDTRHSHTSPKVDSKNIHKSRGKSLKFCWQHFFHQELVKVTYIGKYKGKLCFDTFCLLIYLTLLILIESLILIMSTKLITAGLLEMEVFCRRSYGVIISAHDVTNKILSHDSNYILD